MKLSNRFKNLTVNFIKVWRRFPATIIACLMIGIIVSVIFVHETFDLSRAAQDTFGYILLSLSVFAVYSASTKILIESYDLKCWLQRCQWGLVSLSAVGYYVYLETSADLQKASEVIRAIGILILGVVLFMTAIFYKQKDNSEIFAQRRGWRFVVTCFFWGVIGGGISFVLFSIDRLLNITIYEEAYADVFIFVGALFAPSFFLMDVPEAHERIDKNQFIKLFKVLLQYVFMPLLWAYTAVMYIYFVRLLVTWQWPDGMVANLVLWYALVGSATLYFSDSIKKDNKWIAFFHRWFPYAILLPLISLFVSLGIRMNQYGVTENRYFVGIAGIWLMGSMMYFAFANPDKINIKRIAIALSVLIFISVIGPLGASPVSRLSQTIRFEQLLNDNGLLENGKAIKPETELPTATQIEIRESIRYFQNQQEVSKIRSLPEEVTDDHVYDFFKLSDDVYDAGGYVWIYLPDERVINVAGYDYVMTIRGRHEFVPIDTEKGALGVVLENNMLKIRLAGKDIFSKDLAMYYDDFYALGQQVQSENRELKSDEAVFILEENSEIKVKVMLKAANLNINEMESADMGIEYIVMFALK